MYEDATMKPISLYANLRSQITKKKANFSLQFQNLFFFHIPMQPLCLYEDAFQARETDIHWCAHKTQNSKCVLLLILDGFPV